MALTCFPKAEIAKWPSVIKRLDTFNKKKNFLQLTTAEPSRWVAHEDNAIAIDLALL